MYPSITTHKKDQHAITNKNQQPAATNKKQLLDTTSNKQHIIIAKNKQLSFMPLSMLNRFHPTDLGTFSRQPALCYNG
jgi:hypothetical protein